MEEPRNDRRERERYRVRTGAYAAFMPHSRRRGQIIDINLSGLAFHYIGVQKHVGKGEMAILLNGSGVLINKIKCQAVSDFEATDFNVFSVVPLRRCGIRFGKLTQEQAAKLEAFIQNYSTVNPSIQLLIAATNKS